MEQVACLGLPNCYRLSNGTVDLVVTTDVGPRVLFYGFSGGENVFGEVPDLVTATEWGDWRPLGGHRLWVAPEEMPRAYAPDDLPVTYELVGPLAIRLIAPVDRAGFAKEMKVELAVTGTAVTVHHRIINRTAALVEIAAWALTVMRSGGETVLPLAPYRSHDDYLLPAEPVVRWHFTDLSDPRWTFGKRYLRLRTDETRLEPQKLGMLCKQGWSAYHRAGTLFLKRFDYREGAPYPDYGCNAETYTAGSFIEVESLSPLTPLRPGESVEQVERWQLFRNVHVGDTEATLEAALQTLLRQEIT